MQKTKIKRLNIIKQSPSFFFFFLLYDLFADCISRVSGSEIQAETPSTNAKI